MPGLTPYSYITFIQARNLLAQRLSDVGKVFWVDAELKLYLYEALRFWQALTATWVSEFTFDAKSSDLSYWYDFSAILGSPRARSVLDTDLYTLIQYHFLEPPSGGTWTGTSQFSIADLSSAVQRRRDEVQQAATSGVTQLSPIPFPQAPNSRRAVLADNVLGVRRVRYIPATNLPPPVPNPVILWRGDPGSFDLFTNLHFQEPQIPTGYSVTDQPPITIDTNFPPSIPGSLDVLAIRAGANVAPPAGTGLIVPDDWAWLVKYGAMAELLSKESEARDDLRALYCRKRFDDGLTIMKDTPWITTAQLDGLAVPIQSFTEKDQYDVGWEIRPDARKSFIVAGLDYFSLSPIPGQVTRVPAGIVGVSMQVVENAPLPVMDNDMVQVSRDVLDAILDYAQHIAAFKQGGQEFADTFPFLDNVLALAGTFNTRVAVLSIYDEMLKTQGRREDAMDKRTIEA